MGDAFPPAWVNDLAAAYMNRGMTLAKLDREEQAVESYAQSLSYWRSIWHAMEEQMPRPWIADWVKGLGNTRRLIGSIDSDNHEALRVLLEWTLLLSDHLARAGDQGAMLALPAFFVERLQPGPYDGNDKQYQQWLKQAELYCQQVIAGKDLSGFGDEVRDSMLALQKLLEELGGPDANSPDESDESQRS